MTTISTRLAAAALLGASITCARTSMAADDDASSGGPRGMAMVDRNPKMANAGKVLVLVGLPVAGIGAALIVAGSDSPGGSDELGFKRAGATMAQGAGIALTALGGVSLLTGVVLWAVGESDVEQERVRILRPTAALPTVRVGAGSVAAEWRF